MHSCNTRPRDRRPFDEYRKLAREAAKNLKKEIDAAGSITWDRVMQAAEKEEVVYKLTLKYLREDGYKIGNYKDPMIRKL